VHHWPAFSFATTSDVDRDDTSSPLLQDRPNALVGHDARFMMVPARSMAAGNAALEDTITPEAADNRPTTQAIVQTLPASPKSTRRKLKFYAFGIGYALFAVSTAGASFLLLAASLRPH
jgi:hypothetical protein